MIAVVSFTFIDINAAVLSYPDRCLSFMCSENARAFARPTASLLLSIASSKFSHPTADLAATIYPQISTKE